MNEASFDFELIRLIGHGAYGEVYLARDRNGTYCAVKVIFRESFDHDRPFEREYEGLRKFEVVSRSYDTQVQVLHMGWREDPKQFYYVMELADDQEGGEQIDPETYAPKTLATELQRRGSLPVKECLSVALALARALENLHENGLIHRDVKPGNIIFVKNRPKLADIGLVTDAAVSVSHVGTEGYMPPEGPGSPQADIYSLGKVLYEMSTGRHRLDFPELPTNLQNLDDPEGLLELNAVVVKACERDPRKRYPHARELVEDLVWLQRGRSLRRRNERRRKTAAAAKAAALLTLIAVVGFAVFHLPRLTALHPHREALPVTLTTLNAQVHGQSVASALASFAWVNGVGGASGNVPALCTDSGGNCYAVCHFNSSNARVGTTVLTNSGVGYDSFVVKYNSRGQPLWVKQFFGDASDFGLAVALDSSGSVYIAGSFYSEVLALDGLSVTNATGTNAADIFIAKFDKNGATQWLRRFGGGGTDTAFHVAVDHNDNVLITGSFFSTTLDFDTVTLTNASSDTDMFLAKLDSAGHVLWAKRGGGPKGDAGYRMVVDASNNCLLVGYFFTSATFGTTTLVSAGSSDAYVAEYDSSGNLQWVTSGGGTGHDQACGLAQDAVGNIYVTGYFNSPTATFGGQVIHSAGGNDLFLVKLSPSGAVLWAKSAGGTGDDRGVSVGVDAQGNAYVSGFFSGTATFGSAALVSTGGKDLCLVKYSPSGVLQWVIPASGPADDEGNQLTFDSSGHLYLSGYCSSNTVFGALTLTNTLNNTPFLARLDFLPPNLNIAR